MNLSNTRTVTGIDTHAHIFRRDLPMAEGRRYSPDYDATVAQYVSNLDACGLSHGVLIQPSFLGEDNSHIEQAIANYPDRLRGVAVVSHEVSEQELDRLFAAGFRGARLNLVGRPLDNYDAPEWQAFFRRLAERSMQLEIQRKFEDFASFLPSMMAGGGAIVIDHFGLPPGLIDTAVAQHATLLDLLGSDQIWLKVSASYRGPMTSAQAVENLGVLREASGGIDRMIWGSDWPHTQHEADTSYRAQFDMLALLFPDLSERQQVLIRNAAKLFGLSSQDAAPSR